MVQRLAGPETDPGHDPLVILMGRAKRRGADCFQPPEPSLVECIQYGSSDLQHQEIARTEETNGCILPRSSQGNIHFTNARIQKGLGSSDRMSGE